MFSKLRFAFVLCLSIFAIAQQDPTEPKLAAKDALNKGIAAFHSADFEKAAEYFDSSIHLDPDLKEGHIYLATAYAQQYIPGVETPENLDLASRALDQYAVVLQRDPANVISMKGTAYLDLQLKHFREAKENYKKALELDSADPEIFYSIGVVDWRMVYPGIMEEKSKLKPESEAALMKSRACNELRSKIFANIEDGIAMLTHAIKLRPNYADAMTYVNLLYRLRAALDCGDKSMYAADIKAADKWSDAAMAARRKEAAAEAKHTQDSGTDVLN